MSFTVRLSELADVVERMARFDEAVDAQLSSVQARITSLAATWTGGAATSYAETHAECTRDLAAMRAAVQRLRHLAATAHGNYSAAVSANATMWS